MMLDPRLITVQPYNMVDDSFTWKRLLRAASTGKVSRKLLRGLAALFFLSSCFLLRLSSAFPDAATATDATAVEDDAMWLDEDEFLLDSSNEESSPHRLHTSSLPNVYLQGNGSSLTEPLFIGPLELAFLFICFLTSSFCMTIHVLCRDKSAWNKFGSPSDNKATHKSSAHASVSAST